MTTTGSPALRRTALALTATGLLLVPATALPAAADEAGTGTVTVFHGVPGLTVDVYADGNKLLPDFEPGTFSPATELPADTYEIEVFEAGKGPDGDPAITAEVTLPEGANATIAAHLDEDGEPTLTTFVNDLSSAGDGQGRLTVRHTAAAPAVDVRAGGEPVFENLSNPDESGAELPAGEVSADVVLAGTDDVAIGPADVEIAAGTGTVVYAWGSAEDDTLKLAVQELTLGSAPNAVAAGFGPAEDDSTVQLWALGLAALAAAGLAVSGRRLLATRR